MRRRFSIDAETGLLTDRDGNSLGRVIGLTLEVPTGGYGGSSTSEPSTAEGRKPVEGRGVGEPPAARPTPTQLERDAVERVWAYYLSIIPSRKRLDEKRRRIIRDAIRLVGEEAVKQAALGLSRSPHHNGENPQRRKYLEIRYALKGIGDESDDERIEKAILWAALYNDGLNTQVDPAKVQRWLDDVRYTRSLPHRPERDRAKLSYAKLIEAGFTVVPLDAQPWARLER